MKPLYLHHKHYKYFNKGRFHIEGVSRKTKKFLKKAIAEGWLPTAEEMRWLSLPDCKWCYGSGHYREVYGDTGYGCPDCEGTGKSGWRKKDGKMYCVETGLEVSEY